MKDKEKINEMASDMDYACTKHDLWPEDAKEIAKALVILGYQKVGEDQVVISKEEYEVLKIKAKEKHWLETCMSVWKTAKIDGSQETAKNILNELEWFLWETAINDTKNFDLYQDLYRSIKEYFKNKYGVIKEN